jgi:integrase
VLAALNYAARPTVKLIPFNPMKGYERPHKRSRGGEARVDEAAHQTLIAHVPWDFKQVLLALRHTGTRPSNICRVTAKTFDPDAGVWVFDEHNTEPGTPVHKMFKKTKRALIVPLTEELVELCKRLAEQHPEGPLFRTRRGKKWTSKEIYKRIWRWRKILMARGHAMPERIYPYCYRHQLATDLLENGESDTLVAATLGHKGTRVLHENYSGVTAKSKSVRDLLLRNVKPLPEEVSVSAGTGGKPQPPSVSSADETVPQQDAGEGSPSAG